MYWLARASRPRCHGRANIPGTAMERAALPPPGSSKGGRNISALYHHLGGDGQAASATDPGMRAAVVGPLADPVNRMIASMDEHGVELAPAALLEDQIKAFEMIGLGWLALVYAAASSQTGLLEQSLRR